MERDSARSALSCAHPRTFDGPNAVRSSLAAYIESGNEVPASWLPLAYDERATLLDDLRDDAILVLDEPGMLATIERALEEERSREQSVLLAGVESGEFSVSDPRSTMRCWPRSPHRIPSR